MIENFIFFGQRFFLAVLFRCNGIIMQSFYTSISRICNTQNVRMNSGFRIFKKFEIVLFTVTEFCANNALCCFTYNYLRFYRMSFFLTGVILPLFFLGRCIGLSEASTRITSIGKSLFKSSFLPGSENFPHRIKVSSTHFMVL